MESTKQKNNELPFTLEPEKLDEIIRNRPRGRGRLMGDRERELVNYAILDLMRKGLSTPLIVKEIRQRWDIPKQTAYDWINYAYEDLDKQIKAIHQDNVRTIVERIESTYSDAVKRNDGITQVKALELLTKVTGAQAPQQQEIRIRTDFEFS